jgi:hypothetical protein
MLYKYRPPAIITRLTTKSMPQLDFREALSTPEEKRFSPAAIVAPVSAAAPANQTKNALLRSVGLSRSTWANIVFVAIASVGGLVCAFYFFNGGEVLRAAAAWPNEFLYPRPLSTDKIDIAQQPNPVDQFSESTNGSSKTAAAQGSPEKNVSPADLTQPATQPATTIGTTNPAGVGPLDPGASLISDPTSLVSGLNLLPPATDTLFQSFYQTAISMTPKTKVTRTAKNTTSATRRKVSTTRQKLAKTTTIKSATSTARSTQQTANQNQVGMNTMSAPNQMMTSGGMGGVGGIGGVGAVGGVGGLGGVSGAGLGGGISGTGLGGLLGGHH